MNWAFLTKYFERIVPHFLKSLILFLLLVISNASFAQDKTINLDIKSENLEKIIKEIEQQTDFKFIYNEAEVKQQGKKSIKINSRHIDAVLTSLLKGTSITYKIVDQYITLENKAKKKKVKISGKITDINGEALPGVSIIEVGSKSNGTISDINGGYQLTLTSNSSIEVSYIGLETQTIEINGKEKIDVILKESSVGLEEVVVVGFGTQKKEAVTAAISVVKAEDITAAFAPTASTALAGKLSGVSFRQTEGIPGSSASIQIRNLGTPLYIIDGVEKDAGQFNNIAPSDIESITILKDASAAVYGVRAANGVVLVTTKNGNFGEKNTLTFNMNQGYQSWTRFPEFASAYEWMLGKVHAENNRAINPGTSITPEELAKWKAGTEEGYKNFDWHDYIVNENSPITTLSLNATGGSEKIAYYFAVTHLNQKSMIGNDFKFERTNIQSNITAKLMDRLKVSMKINGRIETRDSPNIPNVWTGGGEYGAAIAALHQNQPMDRPFANDNPEYPRKLTSRQNFNFGVFNKDLSGYRLDTWRVLQTNLEAEYEFPIEGLTMKGVYSNYLADNVMDEHGYPITYYTYDKASKKYNPKTEGSMSRTRSLGKVFENVYQGYLNYNNEFFGNKIGASFIAQRTDRRSTRQDLIGVPNTKVIPLMYFDDLKSDGYKDEDYDEARIGYVGKFNYEFNRKYYAEFIIRRDGSWKFSPDKRWGTFPSGSIGWRLTEESFIKPFVEKLSLDVKLRGSYGILGDDNVGIGAFDYISGYNYNQGTIILDGESVITARDKGKPIDNISWFESKMLNLGFDFSMLNGSINGTFDVFRRKRTGLKGSKDDVVLPKEIGFSLPDENVGSDEHRGIEFSLNYNGKFRDLSYAVGGNVSYSRRKYLNSYNPLFDNSWDHYRNSSENRYTGLRWAFEDEGQFQSYEQIQNHPVDIDGQGNRTLNPGDIIYKDLNGDGIITKYDTRPVGYPGEENPFVNFGFNISAQWKGLDFRADFSGAAMYSYMRNQVYRNAYENEGALLKSFADDSWHRKDPFDPNSEWVAGKYPPLLFNDWRHTSKLKFYGWSAEDQITSTFWLKNLWYVRARTIELGYTIPKRYMDLVSITGARVYINGNNLFSIDNAEDIGIDPENAQESGMAYPQHRVINFGFKITL